MKITQILIDHFIARPQAFSIPTQYISHDALASIVCFSWNWNVMNKRNNGIFAVFPLSFIYSFIYLFLYLFIHLFIYFYFLAFRWINPFRMGSVQKLMRLIFYLFFRLTTLTENQLIYDDLQPKFVFSRVVLNYYFTRVFFTGVWVTTNLHRYGGLY